MGRHLSLSVLCLALLGGGCDRLFGLTHVDPPPPDVPRATTELVQQATASSPAGWTLAATLQSPPTSGNVLVMSGATDRNNLMIPTGGGVTSWTLADGSNTYQNLEVWYGVTDGSSSTVTIACNCAMTTLGNMRISLTEWSGIVTDRRSHEIASSLSGTASPAAPPPLMTLDSPELLILAVTVFGTAASNVSDTTGTWTPLDSISVDMTSQLQWYQLVSEPGTYAPTLSTSTNGLWDAVLVAFRATP